MRNFGTRRPPPMQKKITSSAVPKKLQISATVSKKDGISFFLHPASREKPLFFNAPLDTLPTAATADPTYFPIRLNFEEYEDYTPSAFYASFYREIRKEIEGGFPKTRRYTS